MKISPFVAAVLASLTLYADCYGGTDGRGSTPDNPLQVPEQVENLDRFLLQMAARSLLMTEQEIEAIVKETTDADFADAYKFGIQSSNNILKLSEKEIASALKWTDRPKNEFEARRREETTIDLGELAAPVKSINYFSVDVSGLGPGEYDFDKKGFPIGSGTTVTQLHEDEFIKDNKYVHRSLPNWLADSHVYRSFLPVPVDVAEKWREQKGTLRCVYRYMGSMRGSGSTTTYSLNVHPVRFLLIDASGVELASIPFKNVSIRHDSYEGSYRRTPSKKNSLPRVFWIALVLAAIGYGIYRSRKAKRISPLAAAGPPPLPRITGPPPLP
jgi:hypothetical protein